VLLLDLVRIVGESLTMKNSIMSLSLGLFLLTGCATVYTTDKLTPDELAYMNRIGKATPILTIEKAAADEAWVRGKTFIERFTVMKIKASDENRVETYDPSAAPDGGTIGYTLTREMDGDKVKFTIVCLRAMMNMKYTEEICKNNEKLMSHYMVSAELNEKFVNADVRAPRNPNQPY
jgi:hypothetical protein